MPFKFILRLFRKPTKQAVKKTPFDWHIPEGMVIFGFFDYERQQDDREQSWP